MNCTHHLADAPTGLCCQRDDHPEHPNGHLYMASGCPDGHTVTEDAAERRHEL